MDIVVVHNAVSPSRYDAAGEGVAVGSVMDAVRAVEEALRARGHRVRRLAVEPPTDQVLATLQSWKPDVVFNLCEGFGGRADSEWRFAQDLAGTGIPFTGADARTLELCLDKAVTKRVLEQAGVPTAPFQMLSALQAEEADVEFPVIVKPVAEDASHGIGLESVVWDRQGLLRQVRRVEETYGAPALAEAFLPGREFNASVLSGAVPRFLAASEMVYPTEDGGVQLLTYASKWLAHDPSYHAVKVVCPAQVSEETFRQIQAVTLAARAAVGSPPYARVDIRADAGGRLHVLEVNPNPDLSPDAGMALQARAAGLEYAALIDGIVQMAVQEKRAPEVAIRPLQRADVERLVHLTDATGFFHPDEVAVAREVLMDCAMQGAEESGYFIHVAARAAELLGWVCFGPTPRTKGAWDLYWIAVDTRKQRYGLGKRLMRLAEEEVRKKGGRILLVETSGRDLYAPTRGFYVGLGYREVSRVPDFYEVGDARVIFSKALGYGGGPPM